VLKKLAPATVMLCPAAPLDGLRDAMVGGPPGETAAVVGVDVDADLDGAVVPDVLWCAAPLPAPVVGAPDGGVLVCTELAAVEDGGAELPPNETISAMPAATTSAATAATEAMSQRLGRAAGLT
jgi:hypothetical protein